MERWLKTGKLSSKRSSEVAEPEPDEAPPAKIQATVSEPRHIEDNKKLRPYLDKYLEHGFTFVSDGLLPQCVVCYETLSNASMKPSKMIRHLQTKHTELQNKSIDFFMLKLEELKKSRRVMRKSAFSSGSNNENATLASYEVAQLIAKAGKAHTIAEELILPAAVILCKRMLGDSAAKMVETVPLSNSTVRRRILEMAGNIEDNLFVKLNMSPMFAIQLDESTDVSSKAVMTVFVRFIWDQQVIEDFLFSHELLHTKAADIFKALDDFFNLHEIRWEKCVGVCTDGASAMAGWKTGLQAKVKEVAPKMKWTHCCIHREALVAKRLPGPFQKVLNDVVKIINFIKARPLQSRLSAIPYVTDVT